MNEQLQKEMLEIVTNIKTGTESIWGFLSDQTPEIIRQLLLWHCVGSIIIVCMGLLSFVGAYKFGMFAVNHNKDLCNSHISSESWAIAGVFVPLTLVLAGIFATAQFFTVLKILIAPKAWLLEYFTTMIK